MLRVEGDGGLTEISGTVGQTVTLHVVLYNVRNGISGFHTVIRSSDNSVVSVRDATAPGYVPASASDLVRFESLPDDSIQAIAVDLNQIIEGVMSKVEQLTLEADLVGAGMAAVTVDVIIMNDDKGGDLRGVLTSAVTIKVQ